MATVTVLHTDPDVGRLYTGKHSRVMTPADWDREVSECTVRVNAKHRKGAHQ